MRGLKKYGKKSKSLYNTASKVLTFSQYIFHTYAPLHAVLVRISAGGTYWTHWHFQSAHVAGTVKNPLNQNLIIWKDNVRFRGLSAKSSHPKSSRPSLRYLHRYWWFYPESMQGLTKKCSVVIAFNAELSNPKNVKQFLFDKHSFTIKMQETWTRFHNSWYLGRLFMEDCDGCSSNHRSCIKLHTRIMSTVRTAKRFPTCTKIRSVSPYGRYMLLPLVWWHLGSGLDVSCICTSEKRIQQILNFEPDRISWIHLNLRCMKNRIWYWPSFFISIRHPWERFTDGCKDHNGTRFTPQDFVHGNPELHFFLWTCIESEG